MRVASNNQEEEPSQRDTESFTLACGPVNYIIPDCHFHQHCFEAESVPGIKIIDGLRALTRVSGSQCSGTADN